MSTELPDNKLDEILSENFHWRMTDHGKVVHLDRKKAKTALTQLLLEARLDTLNQIRHSDVKLNHGTIELMGYMSQQLNKQKLALKRTK